MQRLSVALASGGDVLAARNVRCLPSLLDSGLLTGSESPAPKVFGAGLLSRGFRDVGCGPPATLPRSDCGRGTRSTAVSAVWRVGVSPAHRGKTSNNRRDACWPHTRDGRAPINAAPFVRAGLWVADVIRVPSPERFRGWAIIGGWPGSAIPAT